MTIQVSRRGILGMLAAGVGAAIVRPGLIMPIKPRLGFDLDKWRSDILMFSRQALNMNLEPWQEDALNNLVNGQFFCQIGFGSHPSRDDTVTVNGVVHRFVDFEPLYSVKS